MWSFNQLKWISKLISLAFMGSFDPNDPTVESPMRGSPSSGGNINESNTDTLIIRSNDIAAFKSDGVGLVDIMNCFGGRGRPTRIIIEENRIASNRSVSAGIGKLNNKYSGSAGIGKLNNKLTILINYDGRWVNSMYENCKTKGVLVSDEINLEELRKIVYDIVNVDPNEYEITMKVIYESMKTAWLADIADEGDVRAFIFDSLSRPYKIPLCVTLKGKVSNQQALSIDFRQESMPVDLNLLTQADLEDNRQYHNSENDLGNKECKDSEEELEDNTTQQCEDMAYVEADKNIFQDNAEFKELPGDNNMGCDDVQVISIQFDEPNSDKPNSLEHSRMKSLEKGFYDFQSEAAKMDSHFTEWTDKLVQENNTKMLQLQDTVAEIAMNWTKVLRTGDLSTITFNIERGQDTAEAEEFVLNQPEAYETKIGDQVFRRSGDPPLEEVVEKLQNETMGVENDSPRESNRHLKEGL